MISRRSLLSKFGLGAVATAALPAVVAHAAAPAEVYDFGGPHAWGPMTNYGIDWASESDQTAIWVEDPSHTHGSWSNSANDFQVTGLSIR